MLEVKIAHLKGQMQITSGNGWKISLISLPSTLLPVNLPIAADDMTRPVKTKKAARTNEKYMSCASFDFLLFLGGSSSLR